MDNTCFAVPALKVYADGKAEASEGGDQRSPYPMETMEPKKLRFEFLENPGFNFQKVPCFFKLRRTLEETEKLNSGEGRAETRGLTSLRTEGARNIVSSS